MANDPDVKADTVITIAHRRVSKATIHDHSAQFPTIMQLTEYTLSRNGKRSRSEMRKRYEKLYFCLTYLFVVWSYVYMSIGSRTINTSTAYPIRATTAGGVMLSPMLGDHAILVGGAPAP